MQVKHYFATRLKALREEKGLNQGQLAKELGISRGSISFYENGDRTPDIEVFDTICKFFDVSYDYMLGKNDNQKISMEVQAIRDYTHLSDTNIDILHNCTPHFLEDILNDYIGVVIQGSKIVQYIGDYLFYDDLFIQAKKLFYIEQLKKYNIPIEENELLNNETVSRRIAQLSREYEIEYHKKQLKFMIDIQFIADKRDLLEYKISRSFFSDMIERFCTGKYYEKLGQEIIKYNLSDILSGNIKSILQIDAHKELLELYKKEGVTNGNNTQKG